MCVSAVLLPARKCLSPIWLTPSKAPKPAAADTVVRSMRYRARRRRSAMRQLSVESANVTAPRAVSSELTHKFSARTWVFQTIDECENKLEPLRKLHCALKRL